MERRVKKNAMFQVEKRIYSRQEEIEKIWNRIASERPVPFSERLQKIKVWAAEYLLEKDFPDPEELCLSKGSFWCALPDNWDELTLLERAEMSQGANVSVGWAFTKETATPLSPEAIVAEVCQHLFAFEKLSATKQLNAAFQAGRLLQLLSSMRHLTKVQYGEDARTGRRLGGHTTRMVKETERRRSEVVERMAELITSGHNISQAARTAAREGVGTSEGANSRTWYRYRPKG